MNSSPSPTCLFIGTPCYGRQVSDLYAASLLKLQLACQQRAVRLQVQMLGSDALITRARQNVVAHFLDSEPATHLLFIDSDIGFEPEQVFRLLDLQADMAAALYPVKRLDWDKVAAVAQANRAPLASAALTYIVEFENPLEIETRNGFAKVNYAGTGFFMIRRAALLSMIDRYPELRYNHEHKAGDTLSRSPHRFALFNCMIDDATGTYLSEDFSFCRRWTAMGGEIWADLESRLTHVGAFTFSGDVSTQFS